MIGAGVVLAATLAAWPEPWETHDYVLEGVFVGLSLLDLGQTSAALSAGAAENNPVLGPHPSNVKLVGYFSVWIVGHAAVTWLLPRPWREVWLGMGIGCEAAVVLDGAWNRGRFVLRVPW
ncbi:MAG TPA: hypothetical protein VMT17_03195 [Anaeromyxobacteraceae bacterium]|nr:hypothetical protein [Anaeromyxobacteraceae bacterium]